MSHAGESYTDEGRGEPARVGLDGPPVQGHPMPHRQFTERQPRRVRARAAAVISPRVWAWCGQALWLGLAGWWIELSFTTAERWFDGRVAGSMLRTNWYHVGFSLLAHLAMFAVWLLVALGADLALRRRHWGRAGLVMAFLGWFVAAFSALQTVESLHDGASLVLAAGIAARLAAWWDARHGAVIRRTLLPLAAASVLIGGGSLAWVATAERRALAALPPAPRPDAPNVVLLVLDTVRADHLSLHGYHRATTPRLEALARTPGAVRFDMARAPAPWTLPSHASMFTGRWPHELSVDRDRPLDATFPTLAEFLAGRGYATAGFAANSLYCNAWYGLNRGFARYVDVPENQTFSAQEVLRSSGLTAALMTPGARLGLWPTNGRTPRRRTAAEVHADALDWLDRDRPAGRPFFLFLNDFDAHDPYIVPHGFPTLFSKVTRAEAFASNTRTFRALGDPTQTDITEDQRQAARAEAVTIGLDAYDDCLRYLDDQVGRLVDALERRGLRRSTWIIITSDHGEHFGEHDRYWHGSSLYRPVLDVPLLILPPSGPLAIPADAAASPKAVRRPVSLRDLPATVADLIGEAGKGPFPGRSLRRHWDATASIPAHSPDDDPPLSEFRLEPCDAPDPFCTAVVDDDRIYMNLLNYGDALYGTADRAEATNLAPRPDEAAALERLRALTRKTR